MSKKDIDKKFRLKHLNQFITCGICKGYLVNATTVTECLHTFCRSCIVKHLEDSTNCPDCEICIHQSHPLLYISHDRTLQDIVYKIVPNLAQREEDTEIAFYKENDYPMPEHLLETQMSKKADAEKLARLGEDCNYHRDDEPLVLELEAQNVDDIKQLESRYVCVSAQLTINLLKKFIALKVEDRQLNFNDIDIFCNNELMGKDHTLKFIKMTRWRDKNTPLLLCYKSKDIDL